MNHRCIIMALAIAIVAGLAMRLYATTSPKPESVPAIVALEAITPTAAAFNDSGADKPLVLRSAKDAGEYFAAESLAKLTSQVNFEKQIVLLFAWTGSGQDRLDYTLAESAPEQVFFKYRPGRTKDLRQHVRIFVLRQDVKWNINASGK